MASTTTRLYRPDEVVVIDVDDESDKQPSFVVGDTVAQPGVLQGRREPELTLEQSGVELGVVSVQGFFFKTTLQSDKEMMG